MTTTQITVLGGDHLQVEGAVTEVEHAILNAARGSLMELVWLVEVDSGERIGINPECVVMIRAASA